METKRSTTRGSGVTPPSTDEEAGTRRMTSVSVTAGRSRKGGQAGPPEEATPAEQTEEADCPTGDQVHLTSFPIALDDRSHLILFCELPGLAGGPECTGR